MFFDGSFFFKEFCKQFNIHLLIRSQRPKTTGICNIDPIDDNKPKILLFPQDSQMVKAACPEQLWTELGNVRYGQSLICVKLFQNLTSGF